MNSVVNSVRVLAMLLLVFVVLLGPSTFCQAQTQTAQQFIIEGHGALLKGDNDAAIAAYSKAIALDPKSAHALAYRGNVWREKGESGKALDDFVAALRIDSAVVNKVTTGIAANPSRFPDRPFLFAVEDVFYISGRGAVATGRVVRGAVTTGQEVEIVGAKETRKSTISGIEVSRKIVESAKVGDNVGILLRGVGKDEVKRGEVLAAPGSIAPRKTFESEIYMFTKDEGGRSTPIFKDYRPQLFIRTTDVTGTYADLGGSDEVKPGDRSKVKVELIESAALESGLIFAIREGGRTVGMGVVLN